MKFVVITHAYSAFLADFYREQPQLASARFCDQRQAYYDSLFGSADFYARAIQRLGHECEEFVYNSIPMQRTWLNEHCPKPAQAKRLGMVDTNFAGVHGFWESVSAIIGGNGRIAREARRVVPPVARRLIGPLARRLLSHQRDAEAIFCYRAFLDQVRTIRPDILYNHSVFAFSSEQLMELRKHAGLIIGQHAATTLPDCIDYRLYDLIISSFAPTVDYLRSRGARAELVRLAFDPRVAELIPETRRDREVTFSGSLFDVHSSRLRLLEGVAMAFPQLEVHAATSQPLTADSPLAGRIGPPVWGRSMYELMRRSVATLNHHGDVLPFANNMRLYEATGMGCLLVTDWKDNLGEMFEPEKEVVTYRDTEECVDKLRFYLASQNAPARARIMSAGQRRTLTEHTYHARMRQLLALLDA